LAPIVLILEAEDFIMMSENKQPREAELRRNDRASQEEKDDTLLSSESEEVNGAEALEKDLIDPETAGDDGVQVESSDPHSQEWQARQDVRKQQQ
jgi:hypothetical protein